MSNISPEISVVMSVYNGEQYLGEAIRSILNQTFVNFELIIIDDGSTDSSAEITRSYQDERILFKQQENAGLAAALNRGIGMARGKYIARMDADDISYPQRLKTQQEFLEGHSSVVAVGSAAEWVDKDGEYICTIQTPESHEAILETLPYSPFVHPSVMFRKSAWKVAGGYPENFRWGGEDAVLFNKMSRIGELANISQPLIRYRITPDASSRLTKRQKYILEHIISKAINNIPISDAAFSSLKQECRSTSKEEKKYIYYVTIAEKFLWGNPCSSKARKYLHMAISTSPRQLKPWLLYMLSLLPGTIVKSAHKFVKKRIVRSANSDIFR